MIIIRTATFEDAELIADLSRQTFYETYIDDNDKGNIDLFLKEQFSRNKLIEEVKKINNRYYLAYINNVVAGYVRLNETVNHVALIGSNAIEITSIYVIKELIGIGVGTALMEHSIAIAKQLNKSIIWLAVWEKKEKAQKLFLKFGFEKFGEHSFLLGNDLQTDLEFILYL